MTIFKSIMVCVAASSITTAAFATSTAAGSRSLEQGFSRAGLITVESQQYPRLARQIERNLAQLIRQRYSLSQPVWISLAPFSLNPRTRITDRQRLSQPFGRLSARDRHCGPQRLDYDAVRGRIQAKYRLRYQASSQAFRTFRAKAKGRVRENIRYIDNALIGSPCGWRRAKPRQIRHLGQHGGNKPTALIRQALARDVAEEIFQDLRGHLRHQRYRVLNGQNLQQHSPAWRTNNESQRGQSGLNHHHRRAWRR
jgi:hypothetical protein